jgi:hypothetical protein
MVNRFQNTSAYSVSINKFYGKWKAGGIGSVVAVKALIYSDNANSPDALMGASDERTGLGTAGAWELITFSTPVVVPAGAYIWIGVIANGTGESFECLNTGTLKYNADMYSDGPAPTFGSHTTLSYTMPMYVEGAENIPANRPHTCVCT